MTDGPARRLTISVPPDVAEALAEQPNVSAYVTDTVRARKRGEQLTEVLRAAGIQITEEGAARARARRLAVEADWTPERCRAERDRIRAEMLAELTGDDHAHQADAA